MGKDTTGAFFLELTIAEFLCYSVALCVCGAIFVYNSIQLLNLVSQEVISYCSSLTGQLVLKSEGQVEETLPNQGPVGDKDAGPQVDAGKQGKHVPGHANHKEGKSSWPEGRNGVNETQEAWNNGVNDPHVSDGTVKIGIASDGTVVRVHIDGKGLIHGYPLFELCLK